MKKRVVGASGEDVAKEAFWLAWQACGRSFGMGFIQDQPGATKDEVWMNAREAHDYGGFAEGRSRPGEAYGDYVFGRMMKLRLTFKSDTISCRDETPRPDYQAWCRKYPSYDALVLAAATSVGATLEPIEKGVGREEA